MTTALTPFDFDGQAVRVVTIDGEPWFVLTDLCAVLGLANVGNVAARLDEAGVRSADIRSGGQMRGVTVVSEAGMYEVVIRSDKPDAVRFRRWITSEVLPAIRKTGTYGPPSLDLSTPAGVVAMAEQFLSTARQLEAAHARIEQDRPLVQQATTFAAGTGDVTKQTFARDVILWAQNEHGVRVLHAEVVDFLSRKLGLFVRGNRSDKGQATTDAERRGLARTRRGTSDSGHNYGTGLLTPTGQQYAWERIIRHIDEHGALATSHLMAVGS
ncbi:Bro-N domain-containing protein [Oerskovia jenensis]|uniref:Prophage antirepressor-like protein n=1 Tax=Oerskovia jenensis TaxID=162169 RepID=A0ABS2LJV3_9CELL|nr:Bro-N domain-containing protein [Oerskovia jenensis]MBM7480164.1 prophage antirepressor-like protein [Oerskovia jenensis]